LSMTTSSPTVDDAFDRNLCASRKTEVEILMANALEEDLLRVSSEKASGISVILHSEFGTDAIMVKEDERITESALGERVKGLSLFLGDEKLNLALTFEEQMVQDGAHLFAKHANVYRYTFDHDPSRTEYVTVSMDGTSAEFRQWPGDGFVQISSVILGEDKIPVRSGLYSFEVESFSQPLRYSFTPLRQSPSHSL